MYHRLSDRRMMSSCVLICLRPLSRVPPRRADRQSDDRRAERKARKVRSKHRDPNPYGKLLNKKGNICM